MKRYRLFPLLLALCLLLLTACGGGTGKQQPPEEPPAPPPEEALDPNIDRTPLVIAIQDEVVGLDVQQIAMENMVHDLIYEPLVVYNEDLTEIYPSFAESYTATDKYLEFVLPADAKFSNGDPLNAESVKASMDRFLAISEYASDLDPITSIQVVDERTIRYNLSEPAPCIMANIASMYGGIVNAKVAEEIGDWEFNLKPVANGMYYVEEWTRGSQIVLKRNKYFHTNNPLLKNHDAPMYETIIVRFIADDDVRMAELESGNVDVVYNVPTSRKSDLDKHPDYTIYSYMQPGVCYLNLQTEKGVLADINVRRALLHAIDRDALNEALGGIVTPTFGFISPSQFGYSAEAEAKLAEEWGYDPALAQSILAEAGWKEKNFEGILKRGNMKLQLEMMIPGDNTTFKAAGPLIKEQLSALGIDVKLLEYDADYIKELMREDEYTIGSRSFRWVDPDILYYCFTGDSGYRWDDPELTELILRARYVLDPKERAAAYAEVSERLAEDCKAISLFADNYIIVTRGNVKGLFVTTDGRTWFNDVTRS